MTETIKIIVPLATLEFCEESIQGKGNDKIIIALLAMISYYVAEDVYYKHLPSKGNDEPIHTLNVDFYTDERKFSTKGEIKFNTLFWKINFIADSHGMDCEEYFVMALTDGPALMRRLGIVLNIN